MSTSSKVTASFHSLKPSVVKLMNNKPWCLLTAYDSNVPKPRRKQFLQCKDMQCGWASILQSTSIHRSIFALMSQNCPRKAKNFLQSTKAFSGSIRTRYCDDSMKISGSICPTGWRISNNERCKKNYGGHNDPLHRLLSRQHKTP